MVNAFANTYSLEFDDYGFLVFGVDKEKREITRDVEVLRTKGTDKLDAEIGQQIEKYLYPSPVFQLFSFEEATVGKWGCLIIYPNQNPLFIFKKEYTGKVSWRVGEWREGETKKSLNRMQMIMAELCKDVSSLQFSHCSVK